MSEENQEVSITPEIVEEARKGGWVPLEEFRDDEKKWVDAETFVKRGREINPILRKHNKELQEQVRRAQADAKEAIETAKEFKEFQKKAFEREKAGLESQIAQLKQAKRQAVTDGDGDRVVDIDEAIDDLKEQKTNLVPPKESVVREEAQIDPILQRWLDKNTWFTEDTSLTRKVNGLGAALKMEFPNLQGQAFLDKLDEEIKETFPDKFKREKPVSGVESGSGSRPSKTGKKTYDDLPAEAKAACNKYIKQGLFKTKEEYVAEYEFD